MTTTDYRAAWDKAWAEGRAAGEAAVPTPMVVYEADGLSDRPAPGGQSWYVSEGVCGFAWVNVKPGNSRFANWLKKNGYARKAYGGGVDVWISAFGQSMVRKEAMAYRMAEVLRTETGEERIYADSRMD